MIYRKINYTIELNQKQFEIFEYIIIKLYEQIFFKNESLFDWEPANYFIKELYEELEGE